MNLPYVDETWLSQCTNESLVSSLLEAVKTCDMKVDLLRPREAYRRYGAVGISGALVFMSDSPKLPDF